MNAITKTVDGIVFTRAKFSEIKSEDPRYMSDYNYYGQGGINRCPEPDCDIWVNHDRKVYQVVHWTEK